MAKTVSEVVGKIIREVRSTGDKALCCYALAFDHVRLSAGDLAVKRSELSAASRRVSPAFLQAIRECAKNIERFAKAEKKYTLRSWMQSQNGIRLGQLVRPVESVGIYVPGGRYPYPSTVLMTAIPARVAGVRRIVMATPPKNLTPEVLAAAALAGVDAVYRMGGAGAIAALGIGTKTVDPVDLIVGPGNQYVTEAKRQIFGAAGIDALAGPSEVAIIADKTTPLDYVLNDLQAQAEHDPDARSTLLCTDAKLISQVRQKLVRGTAAQVTLIYFATIDQAIEAANHLAPEHLEILVRNAQRLLPKIKHAGAIFLGPSTPAALGDYVAGPSHVLPTHRAARFSSGLSVATFLKRSSVVGYQAKPSERAQWQAALMMGQTEGMVYHAASLRSRMAS